MPPEMPVDHINAWADPVTSQPAPSGVLTQWAIIELFGHGRIAGAVSEQTFGGAHLVRVDVPAIIVSETRWHNGGDAIVSREIPAHSRSLGPASIYSINWCDELAATAAAVSIKHEPISPYSLQRALASLPDHEQHRLLALATATSTAAPALEASPASATGSLFGKSDDECPY